MAARIVFLILFYLMLITCRQEAEQVRLMFDGSMNHIGDSIIGSGRVKKIVVFDSIYQVDSIVYDWHSWPNSTIKSKYMYKAGRRVFENIDYYSNGLIKSYQFFDEEDSTQLYKRLYNERGEVVEFGGKIFFQGFITTFSEGSGGISVGSKIIYVMYFPSPPDCEHRIYILNDDSTKYDVFRKSKYIDNCYTVEQDISDTGAFKVNIVFELTDSRLDTVYKYNKAFYYNAVYNN